MVSIEKILCHITSKSILLAKQVCVFFIAILFTSSAFSNPSLNNIGAGNVTIQQSPNSTVINQSSPRAILNWNSFNIGPNETTHFQQPAGGVALNRISADQGASQIYGRLTATGQIILINPAGIYFGPSAYVNVGGLIASTANISDHDFMAGIYRFTNAGPGSIVNEGTIIAAQHGLVALIGGSVTNKGYIQADLGNVVLASGNAFTMTFAGNNLISFSVDEKTLQQGGVTNTGTIRANGGTIMVSAKSAAGVLDNVINMEGVAQARSVGIKDGQIILGADNQANGVVRVAGKLDVSGKNAGEKGGWIQITGKRVLIDEGANLDASGHKGGGTVLVGGDYQGKGALLNATDTVMLKNSVINANALYSGNGGKVILWADNYTYAGGEISAKGGTQGGDGGFIETSGHEYLDVAGISINVSAPLGKVGTWLLDPRNVTISTGGNAGGAFGGGDPNTFTPTADNSVVNTTTLQNNLNSANVIITTGSTGTQNGDITVSNPITWTSSNSLTLQAAISGVNGSVTNGNIFINAGITGLTGTLNISAGGTITPNASGAINVSNFNLQRGSWNQVGSLAAFNVSNNFQINSGSMPNANTSFIRAAGGTGAVLTPYQITDIYGLQGIGANANTLNKSYILNNSIDATVTKNWNSGAGFIPIGTGTTYNGVIGTPATFDGNNFTINNLYINTSGSNYVGLFSTAGAAAGSFVTIKNIGIVGGTIQGGFIGGGIGALVGQNFGTITNAYNTATVNLLANASNAGGLVGANYGPISNSWNLGTINALGGSAGVVMGGLVGYSATNGSSGNISNSYNGGNINVTTGSGLTGVGGLVGVTGGNIAITDTYSYGAVNAPNATQIGGLVGRVDGGATLTINGSYASGAVSKVTDAGGLVGYVLGTLNVNNSFWDSTTTGQSSSVGSTGAAGYRSMTTAEMKTLANFTTPANGFVLVANPWSITGTPSTTATAPANNWFIFDGSTRPILMMESNSFVSNAHQLQMMSAALGNSYTLVNDIDLSFPLNNAADIWGKSANGFIPIGTSNSFPYSGTFNGANFAIKNLFINRSAVNTGLFGYSTGTIQNVSLIDPIVTGEDFTGSLVGESFGTISNIYSINATVTGGFVTGGLIARINSGNVNNVWVTGTVSGDDYTGGIVGSNNSLLSLAWNGANVNGANRVGGISGNSANTIENVYSTGSVTGNSIVGGLVGDNLATINTSYSSGLVSGNSNLGGLVGQNSGSVNSSYWDIDTSGQSTSAGGTGLSTTNAMGGLGNYTGFSGGTWIASFGGNTYRPLLIAEESTTIRTPHQLLLIGAAPVNSFTLGNDIDMSVTSNVSDVWGNGGYRPIPILSSGAFSLNGNNYAIKNLTITTPYIASYNIGGNSPHTDNMIGWGVFFNAGYFVNNSCGLAGSCRQSLNNSLTVSNLNITNYAYSNSTLWGSGAGTNFNYVYLGGLIGDISGLTTLTNIYTQGTITSTYTQPNTSFDNSKAIGGIVGNISGLGNGRLAATNLHTDGVITDSTGANTGGLFGGIYTVAGITNSVSGSSSSMNINSSNAGGLIGFVTLGGGDINITNAYATGNLSSSSGNGGLIGQVYLNNLGTLSLNNVYASGAISGSGAGGLIGSTIGGNGTITASNSFWDTSTTGTSAAIGSPSSALVGATGKTTSELLQTSTYLTWSIATASGSTWFMANGMTRPILQNENQTVGTNINYATIFNLHQLQLMAMNPTGSYTLGNSINAQPVSTSPGLTNTSDVWAGGTNGGSFVPIGNNASAFNGTFDGNGYTISNLSMNIPSSYTSTGNIGLFGDTGNNAYIHDIQLTNFNYNVAAGAAASNGVNIGGLVGVWNGSAIDNAYVTGGITLTADTATPTRIGGLVGLTNGGIITNSYANPSINITLTTNNATLQVGGLIGSNSSAVSNSFSSGSISMPNSPSGGSYYFGGFVGQALAESIANTFSFTNLNLTLNSGSSSNAYAGGFAGQVVSNNISNSFAAGNVTATNFGNKAGFAPSGSLSSNNNFWDMNTTSLGSDSSGATGESTQNMMTPATFSSWDSSVWGVIANQSYPYLKAFYSSTPQAVSGFISPTSSTGTVTIAQNGIAASTPTALITPTSGTASTGFYYLLFTNNTLSNLSPIISIASNGISGNSLGFIPGANASLSGYSPLQGLDLTQDTVTLNLTNGNITPLQMSTAAGGLSNILYTVAGNNILLTSDKSFATTTNSGTPTYNLGGNITASGTGNIQFGTAVTLGADSILSSGSGLIRFFNTLDGAHALTVNTSGTTEFDDNVGDNTALTSLETDAAGLTYIGKNIKTSGNQTYYDNVEMGWTYNKVLEADNFLFNQAVNFDYHFSVAINAQHNVTFEGNVSRPSGGANSLAITAGLAPGSTNNQININGTLATEWLTTNGTNTTTYIRGGNISTYSGQTYNTPVILDAANNATTTFSAEAGGSNITFNNTVNAAPGKTQDIDFTFLNNSGNVNFNGDWGGNNGVSGAALRNLNVSSSATGINLQGNISTTGTQVYNDAVTLTNAATLSAGNFINFESTIDGGFDLTVASDSFARFRGDIGSSTRLASFTARGATVNTNGFNIFEGTADDVRTTGAQTYYNTITASNSVTYDSSGSGDIDFRHTYSSFGAPNLTVNTSGTTYFRDVVNNITTLTTNAGGTTNISAASITAGTQNYNDNVVLGGNTVLNGNVTMAGTLNGGNNTITINNSGTSSIAGIISNLSSFTKGGTGTLTLSGANTYDGTTSISDGTLIANNAAALGSTVGSTSITAGATLDIRAVLGSEAVTANGSGVGSNGAIISSTTGSLSGNVTLGSDTTIGTTGGGTLTLSGNLDGAHNLTLSGAGIVGLGTVGGSTPLASLTSNSATTRIGGNITTTGAIDFNGGSNTTVLTANSILTSTGNAAVSFDGTLDGPFDLTVNTGGNTNFNEVVGGTASLASITTDAAGTTLVANHITTFGDQEYYDIFESTWGANRTLTAANLLFNQQFGMQYDFTTSLIATGNVTLGGNVLSLSGGDSSLAVTAGNQINLNGTVGGNYVSFGGAGTTYIRGGNVSVNANLAFDTPVVLDAANNATTTISSALRDVVFNSTLNAAIGKTQDVIISSPSGFGVYLVGVVGGNNNAGTSTALRNLTINGGGDAALRANITTTGTQNYQNNTILGGISNLVLTSTGAGANGNITFAGLLDGNNIIGLTINSSGTTTFSNAVGGGALLLTFLTTDTGGSTIINNNVTTSGIQTYNDAIQLGGTLGLSGSDIIANAIDLQSFGLTLTNTGTSSAVSGVISGTGAVTKAGTGTLTLSGNNSYTGATNINAGTLIAQNATALGTTVSNITTIASGATLDIGAALGNEAITVSGTGVGGNGALISSTTGSLSGAVTLAGNTSIGGAGSLTLSGLIGESGGSRTLTKIGAGTTTLDNAANTYTGATTINGGTLGVTNLTNTGSNSSVGTNASITIGGGAILRHAAPTASNSNRNFTIASGGGTITNATGTLNLNGTIDTGAGNAFTIINNATSSSLNGQITGSGSFTKSGAADITLSNGTNNYSGVTTVTQGVLSITHANGLGASSAINVSDGATLHIGAGLGGGVLANTSTITLNGQGFIGLGALSLANYTINNNIVFGSNASIGGLGDNNIINGLISDGGNGYGLTKQNTGAVLLANGANSYGGSTTINSGTLSASTLANTSSNSSIGTGANISIANFSTFAYTGGATSTNRNFTITSGPGTIANTGSGLLTLTGTISNVGNALVLDTSGAGITANGLISGAATLTKEGANTLTLGGANTYSGVTTINAGTLIANNAAALGTIAAGTTIADGATLDIGAAIGNEALTITGTGVGGNGALISSTTGSLSGAVTLAGGTSAGGAGNLTLSGSIGETGGARTLTKVGAGILTLSGDNNYSGGTNIGNGTVSVAHANGLGTSTVNVNGGTLNINNVGIANALSLSGTNALTATGAATANGNITLNGTTTVGIATNSDSLAINGVIDGANALTFTGNGALALNGEVGGTQELSSLTTSATGSGTTLNADVTTTGAQAYNNAVTLGTDINLATTNSNITLTAVDGAHALALSSGNGSVNLNGIIGGGTALNSFSVTTTGAGNNLALANNIRATTTTFDLGGALTQSVGGINSTTLNTTTVGGVTLNGSNTVTNFNAANATSGNVSLTNTGALSLDVAQSGGNLTINNTGAITQSAALSVNGTSSFNAGANAITLNNAANNFIDAVSLSNSGANNISLRNAGNLALGNLNVGSGSLTLQGVGVSQTGAIIQEAAAGTVTITAGAGVIDLAGANRFTGTVAMTNSGANAVTLNNSGSVLNLGASTLGSGVKIITNDDALNINGIMDSAGGNINITTAGGSAAEHIITVDAGINSNGGNIVLDAANNGSGSAEALVINAVLNSGPGTGGTLTLSGGLELGSSLSVGAGNITLQGNGANLNLIGTQTFNVPVAFNVTGNINFDNADVSSTSGALTFSSPVNLTGTNSVNAGNNNVTFADVVNGGGQILSLLNTGGTITFGGNLVVGTLNTAANNYNVVFNGASNTIGTATTFNNIGDVSFANGGTTTFTNGVDIGGNTNLAGNLNSTNAGISLGAVTLTGNSGITTGSGVIDLTGAVNGGFGLTLNGDDGVTFGDAVGGGTALTSIDVTGATVINSGSVTTTGTQIYRSATSLGADTTLTGSGITLGGNVTGNARDLNLVDAGTSTISGSISGVDALTTNAVNLNSSSIATTGAINFGGAATLGANNNISSSAGAITFASTVNGGFGLTANGNSGVTFSGAVGGGTALASVDVTGATAINGGSVNTTGAQRYRSATTLGNNTTFASSNNAIAFDGALNSTGSARNLTVNAGSGAITLGGNAGDTLALGAMNLNSTDVSTIGGTVNAASLSTNAGGTTVLNGGAITTSGTQIFADVVTLGANTTLNTSNSAISFSDTIDSSAARSLTINAGNGAISFSDDVGATNALGAISLNSGAVTTINGTINSASFATNAGGSTILNGGSITTSGAQSFGDAVTLGANTSLATTNNAISLAVVDGAQSLTLSSGTGAINLNGDIGANTALINFSATRTGSGNGIALANDITTTNAINVTAGGAITQGGVLTTNALTTTSSGGTTLTGNNDINAFTATNTGSGNIALVNNGALNIAGISQSGGNFSLNNTGAITQSGAIGVSGTSSFNAVSNAITLNNASNNFTGAVSLNNSGANDISLRNNGNLVLGTSSVGSGLLTLRGTGISQTGAITQAAGAGNVDINAGAGVIDLASANKFTGTVFLTNSGTNDVTLNNSGSVLNLGTATFGDGVKTITNDDALNINGVINSAGKAINIKTQNGSSAAHIITVNAGINSNGGDVNLTAKNNSTGSVFALVVNGLINTTGGTGTGTMELGGGVQLNTVPIVGGGSVVLRGSGNDLDLGAGGTYTSAVNFTAIGEILLSGTLNAAGDIGFLTALTLTGNTTIGDGTQKVTFNSVTGANDLIVDSTGTTFNGAIDVVSLTTTGTGTDTINADITTSGMQNYGKAISLGSDATLNAGASNIILSGVSGAHQLTLTSSGTQFIDGSLSGLTGFTTSGGGTTVINIANINTSGNQTYGNAVSLLGDATFNAGSGSININNGLDAGTHDLTLTSNGTKNINSTLSNVVDLTTSGSGATVFNINGITTTGNQLYNNAVSLSQNAILDSGANDITFGGSINGASALTLTSSGTTTLIGNVGDNTALSSLMMNGGGSTIINGSSVRTSGLQTYDDAVTLGTDVSLTSTSDNVNFNNTVSGPFSLDVSANRINVNGGGVSTQGNQSYNGLVDLGNDAVFNGQGTSTIAFNNGITGGNDLDVFFGASGAHNLVIDGALNIDDVTVSGGGGSNAIAVNAGGAQAWNITGVDSGDAGLTGTNSFSYTNIQNLSGGSDADTFTLAGGTLGGSINGSGGTNTLAADNVNNTWTVTGANSGSVTGVGGGYSNIQNLQGGMSNDEYHMMNGGSVGGNINGGGGSNTLYAKNNVNNTWNLSGTNAGNVSGVAGFSNIQNLTGGVSGNTFNFASGSKVTGFVNGGSPSVMNTFSYLGWGAPISVVLTTSIFAGNVVGPQGVIANYANIDNMIGNGNNINIINLPGKQNTIHVTGPQAGYINDPLYFSGFSIFAAAAGSNNNVVFDTPFSFTNNNNVILVGGVPMTFNGGFNLPLPPVDDGTNIFNQDVSKIIQQPDANGVPSDSSWITLNNAIDGNLNQIISQAARDYDVNKNRKINPFCYATSFGGF